MNLMSLKTYKQRTKYVIIAQELWVSVDTVKHYFTDRLQWTAISKKIAKYLKKVQMEELGGYLTD